MGRHIRIAFDATPTMGAGICVIYEEGETTQYVLYAKPHAYGSESGTFEMKNGINVLKQFKKYLDSATVDIYCDNPTIESEDHPQAIILRRQIDQIQDYYGCEIGLSHDTIGEGNLLVKAANELSRKRRENCEEILMGHFGAKPMRSR